LEHLSRKQNLIRNDCRTELLAAYQTYKFRTFFKIPGNGQSVVDYTVYFHSRGSETDCLMLIEVSSLSSRSAAFRLLLNKHDLQAHIDPLVESYLHERDRLIGQLERLTKLLILSRRCLYKALEINRTKGNGLAESFSNKFKFSRERRGFLDKNNYELELVGHFPKRFGKHFCIVTVYRHIRQKLFRIKILLKSSLKTFDVKMYFHDVANLMASHSRDILPANYACLEYVSTQAPDMKAMAKSISMIDEEQAKDISRREDLRTVAMDDLSTLVKSQRILLNFMWYYVVHCMRIAKFRTMEPLATVASFQGIMKQSLLQQFVCVDPLNHHWIEVNIGKSHVDHVFRQLDHAVSPQTILDMELMVSSQHLASNRVTSEKVWIRDLLGISDPLLHKIHANRFRIADLVTLSQRIYEVVLAGLQVDGTLRFKKVIHEKAQIAAKTVKILANPLDRLQQSPEVNLISIDKLYLLESKLMAGTYPVTLCSFVLTRSPFKLCTLLLLTRDKFLAVLQNKSTLKLNYKEYEVTYIAQSVPFLRQMIEAGQFALVAQRVRLVLFNVLLIDVALDC
jgi:hypothetical protein